MTNIAMNQLKNIDL